jgi:hypothetical protein
VLFRPPSWCSRRAWCHPGQARMRHRTRGLDPTSARREWLTAKDRFVVRVDVDNNSSKGAFFPSPQLLRKLTRYAPGGADVLQLA